ncbi:MAG: ACR3 family arsenite efflux transporter [Proteobacteria bacterium]|nr:ACR3 family arsenite efflux transporter [Pseudomonadota bacterium]NIS70276.1 ACR3 family arsenite efflux transporter [Pseudomonadota bacterium]
MSSLKERSNRKNEKGLTLFEKYLSLWVGLCIVAGIFLGKIAPGVARFMDGLAIYVGEAPVVSIPIAVCLFFMMYPIMVKIDFAEVLKAGKNTRPVGLTLFVNWAIKPFSMYAISILFLGTVFVGFIGTDVTDYVKMPLGLDLPVGATHGAGTVVLVDGVKTLAVPLWRSYLAGCILLGIAPCTAMVLVWGYLAKGNDGHTLVMVAINSLTMLFLYGPLGGFLLGVGRLPVPWQALLLSIGIYVALPLVAGYFSRRWILRVKGEQWFKERFLPVLTPVTIVALLVTLVLLFSFKGDVILSNPLTILWIAIPLFIQTNLIFWLAYGLARVLRLTYEDAAPSAMIGASNHFEVAIATSVMLFGLASGAALATVVGVLIEVPVMLLLVGICKRTRHWFRAEETADLVSLQEGVEETAANPGIK